MPDAQPEPQILTDIDLRQDELLRELDELNSRLEQTLAQFASFAPATARPGELPRREAA